MEITINGHNYRVGKLDALKQFHITRRLAPALASVGLGIAQLQQAGAKVMGEGIEAFLPVLGPVSEIVASMSDEDANYILFTCLGVVTREQDGGRFAKVSADRQLMFEDIDMVLMLRLTVEVVRFNLQGFFSGLAVETQQPSS
jgi:hypothetical protein